MRDSNDTEIAVFASALGYAALLLRRGRVAALALADDAASARRELRADSVPEATHDALVERVRAALGSGDASAVPLDPDGTPFQRRVWAALAEIPAGETRSYGDLARSLGVPSAARAVGTACGANPIAVFVPCHRALRADGGLGGYRWGLARKQALLARERASVTGSARARPSSG
jgi:AraC family transcriptional regulator of adaptative response/methylated-DNA-[protein]-cysteine methyltransferase